MQKAHPNRQGFRKGMILIVFLLFPLIINYFSPYIIIDAAMQGIVNGSLITFGLMFLASIFLGRAWCGWVCPAGGLQDACSNVRSKRVTGPWPDRIKWMIWVVWIGLIVTCAVLAGGYRAVDPFYLTEDIISVSHPESYFIYYTVVGLVVVLSFTVGNRAFCHTSCWMAPFMILGRKLSNVLHLPSLRLAVEPEKCSDCMTCTRGCPMSLDVNKMVKAGRLEHNECILCGTCVDHCTKSAIHFDFAPPEKAPTKLSPLRI